MPHKSSNHSLERLREIYDGDMQSISPICLEYFFEGITSKYPTVAGYYQHTASVECTTAYINAIVNSVLTALGVTPLRQRAHEVVKPRASRNGQKVRILH